MKVSGMEWFNELSRGVVKLLRTGNGLISHDGQSRYTVNKASQCIHLMKGELHIVAAEADIRDLKVHSGIFWVTLEGEAKDYILKLGESLLLPSEGKTVIEALEGGEIELT
jgi:hypothetical protein